MQRQAFAFQGINVQRRRVVDDRDASLRRDEFGDGGQVGVAMAGGEDERGRADAERGDLCGQRLVVIDHEIGTERAHPVAAGGTRGGGDDGGIRQRFRQLDGDGADAARRADDKQRVRRAGDRAADVQPLKQRFPGGERGQRQGGGFGEIEAARFGGDEARVHRLKLRIRAGTVDGAGVIDLVARAEILHGAADRLHYARGVPAQDAVTAGRRRVCRAHFDVGRIDGDGAHFDQHVVRKQFRRGQFDIEQRGAVADGQGAVKSDGFHVYSGSRKAGIMPPVCSTHKNALLFQIVT